MSADSMIPASVFPSAAPVIPVSCFCDSTPVILVDSCVSISHFVACLCQLSPWVLSAASITLVGCSCVPIGWFHDPRQLLLWFLSAALWFLSAACDSCWLLCDSCRLLPWFSSAAPVTSITFVVPVVPVVPLVPVVPVSPITCIALIADVTCYSCLAHCTVSLRSTFVASSCFVFVPYSVSSVLSLSVSTHFRLHCPVAFATSETFFYPSFSSYFFPSLLLAVLYCLSFTVPPCYNVAKWLDCAVCHLVLILASLLFMYSNLSWADSFSPRPFRYRLVAKSWAMKKILKNKDKREKIKVDK